MSNTPDYIIRILPTSNVSGYRFSGTDRNGPIDESVLNPTLTFNVGDRIGILFISDMASSIPNQSHPLCDHALILRKPDLTIAGEVTDGCPENTTISCCSWYVDAVFAKEIEDAGTWTYESNSSQPNSIGGNIIFLPWKRAKSNFFALHSDWIASKLAISPDACDQGRGFICNDINNVDASWVINEPGLWPFYTDSSLGDIYYEGKRILTSLDSIFLPDGMSMHIFDGNDSANEEIFRAVGPILIWDGLTGNNFVPEDIHARLSLQDSSLGGKWGDYVPVDRIFLNHPDSPNNGLPDDCFYRIPSIENVRETIHGFIVWIAYQALRQNLVNGEIVEYDNHTLELRSALSATPTTTTFPPTCGWFDENDSVGSITMDVAWEGDPSSGFVRVDSKNLPLCHNVECDILPLEFVAAYREAPVRAAPVTLVVTFSQPVPNPILFINGLGGATPMTIQFSEDFEILCTELSDDASSHENGTCASPITRSILDDRTVTGRNGGFGIIGFPGLHSSITFVYSGAPTNEGTPIGQYRWGFCTNLPAAQTTTTTSTTTTTTTEAPTASPCFVSIASLLVGSTYRGNHQTNPEIDGINAQTPDMCSTMAGIDCNQPETESTWKFTSSTVVTFNGNVNSINPDLGSIILRSCDSVFVAQGNSFHIFDNNDVEKVRFTGPCLIIADALRSFYKDERILDNDNPDLGGEDIQGNLSTRPSSLGGNWGDYITNDRVFFFDELPSTQGELFANVALPQHGRHRLPNLFELPRLFAALEGLPWEAWKFEIRTPTTCGDPITTTTLPPAYCIEETEYDADKHIIVSGPSSECLIECATSPAPTTPEPSTTTTTTADPVDDKVTCTDALPACLISENGTAAFGDSDIELATLPNGQTQLKIRSLSTDFQVAIGSFDPGSGDSNNDEYQSKFDNSCIPGFPESVSDAVGYLGMKFYLDSGKFLGSMGNLILRHNDFLTGEIKSFITGNTSYQYLTIEKTIEQRFSDFVSNGWDGESTLTVELIGQMFDCEPGDGTTYNACASKTVNFTPAPVGCANYIVNFQGDKVEDNSINTHWIHPEEADNLGDISFKNINGIKHLQMLDGGSVQIKSLDRIADADEDFTIEFSFEITSIAEGCVLFSNNVSGSFSDSGFFQIEVYTDNNGNRRVRIGIQNPEYIPTGFTSPPFVSIVHSKIINVDDTNNLLSPWYTLSFSRKNGVLKFYITERSIDLGQNSELVGSPPWFTAEDGEFSVYYESDEASKTFPCPIGRTENKLTLGFNNFYIGSKDSSQSFRGQFKDLYITNHSLGKISTFDAPISELDPCETQEPQPELNCFSPFLQLGEQRILDGDLSITSTAFNSVINTLDSPFALSGLNGPVDSNGDRITSIDGLAIGPGYKLDIYTSNSDASADTNKMFSLTGPLLLDGSYLGPGFFDHIDDCDSGFLSVTQRQHCQAYNENPLTGYAEIIKTFNPNIKPEYPWNSVFPTWSRKFLGDPSILAILETHLRALQDIGPSPTLANLLLGKHGVLRKQIASDCIEHTFPTTSTTAEPTTSTTTTTTPFPIDIDDYGTNASSVVFEQPIEIEIQKAMGVYGEQTFHNIQDEDEALYTGLGSQSGIWYKWDIVEKSLNLLHGKASGVAGIGSSSNSYLLPENDGSDWVDLIETEHRHSNGFFSYFYTGRQLPTIASIWFNSDEMFPEPSFNTYDIRIGVENTSRTERTEHQLMFDQRPLSDFKIVSPVKSIRYDPDSNITNFNTDPRLDDIPGLTDFGSIGRPLIESWYLGRDHSSAPENPMFFEATSDGNIHIFTVDTTDALAQCPNGLNFRIVSQDGQARNAPAATTLIFNQYGITTRATHFASLFEGDRIIIDSPINGGGDRNTSIWGIQYVSNYGIPLSLYDTFHNRAVANDTNNIVDRNYDANANTRGKGNEPVTWEIVAGAGDTHNAIFFMSTDSNNETYLFTFPQGLWEGVIGTVPDTLEVRVRCTITRTGTIIETPLTFDIRQNRDFALPNLYLDNSSEKLKLIHKDTPDDESYSLFDDPDNPTRNDNNEPSWKNPRYSSTQNLALVDAWSEHGWDDTVFFEWRRYHFNRLRNSNVPEDVVTIYEVKIGDGDFIPFYMSSPSNTMPLSIDIDIALEPVSIGPVRSTDYAAGPLRQFPEQNPAFTEDLNTVVKLISNTDNDHILFPSCTDLQFRRYDCQGVPEIIRDRLLAGTVPDTVLAWHFMGRTRARLATEEVGPLGSGNIITSDIYNIPSPHANGCPTEDPGFTNLYISFD